MDKPPLVTVVETATFTRQAQRLLTDDQRQELAAYLAEHPAAGTELGSGVRKLRWGPRAAFRVVHFFASERFPVILLDIFAKKDKANYSPAELAAIRAAAKDLL